ncbi:MAG: ROK family protein [Candidatus Doudnabacteria bacterium]|nr:ROK family protein [Candidatus Doudnabacteria bacterium]
MQNNVIGIDIGGTKINGVLFDGKKVLKELEIKTPDNLFDFEKNLLKLTDFLSANAKVSAVGVGMAGLIDLKTGVVKYSPNIKFIKNFQLAKFFKLNGYKNVRVDNDAKCFARAENMLGQGRGVKNMVGITLGTGIGGGIIFNGEIYRGARFGAGEFGHMMFSSKETIESVFQKARDKQDNKALAEIIGVLFTNIYRAIDPDCIILGGGVATDKSRNFINQAKAFCKKNLLAYKIEPKNILVSKLKNAGALGAALLFFQT